MSACCEFIRHLFALVAHHTGHHSKVGQEVSVAAILYPPHRRRVKAQPQDKGRDQK